MPPDNTSAAPRELLDSRLDETRNPAPQSRVGAAEFERVAREPGPAAMGFEVLCREILGFFL